MLEKVKLNIKTRMKPVKQFYVQRYDKTAFFCAVIVGEVALILLLSWLAGHFLMPGIDSLVLWRSPVWGKVLGVVARLILIVALIYVYYLIMTSAYQYKPIKRDRLLFARSGLGLAVYSLIGIVLFFGFIVSVAHVSLSGVGDQLYREAKADIGVVWGILSQFTDPGNLPHAMGWGRPVAFISALAGIIGLSGLMISSLVALITRQTQRWKQGMVRYKLNFKDYVVVIGMNEQAATIVKKSLSRNDVSYVLIQTNRNVERQRARLELKLNREEEERVVFYYGERTLYEDIVDLSLQNAREVYILGENMGSENEQDHDSFNMKCLELISQYCMSIQDDAIEKRWWGKKLKCNVDLEYQSTYTIFKSTHIYKLLNQSLEFIPFNVYEIWAKKVLVDNYAIIPGRKKDERIVQRYLPIDSYKDKASGKYCGIGLDCDKSVHLIIMGMNQMGMALAMQAALLIHLPNYSRDNRLRTTITFIDAHAAQEGEFLRGKYAALFSLCRHRTIVCGRDTVIKDWADEKEEDIDPMKAPDARYKHLGDNFMDIQWEFIEGNVASQSVRDYLEKQTADTHQTCTIAVCFNDPQQSIATSLYLPELVLKKVHQVLVYQRNNFDLINKVATGEKRWKRYEKLRPFGMITDCYKGDMFDTVMPKLVLALYKSNKDIKQRSLRPSKNIDPYIEFINHIWTEEGIVNRLSNINSSDGFMLKLRSVGLSVYSSEKEIQAVLNDEGALGALAEAEHQRWLTERLTMGYRPLDAKEMSFFQQQAEQNPGKPLSIEAKARKEYYKVKSRAHLDICSCQMLNDIDLGVNANDKVIIKNLIGLTFFKVESKIISRLALRKEQPGIEKSENLRIAAAVLHEMQVVKNYKSKDKIAAKFWIGKYPVTQAFWKTIMGQDNNPSMPADETTGNHPVNCVSKDDVDDFIMILNDLTGLHFALPLKEEWYHAALGGKFRESKNMGIPEMAWYNGESKTGASTGDDAPSKGRSTQHRVLPHTHPVGTKQCNGFGLYDMLGNVWEWTRTMDGASTFCFCGGSWRYGMKECDLSDPDESWCNSWVPEHKSSDLGFRLVLYHNFPKDETEIAGQMIERRKMIYNIMDHMEYVGEGRFMMGTDDENVLVGDTEDSKLSISTLSNERPAFEVEMSDFAMLDTPVTQRQYNAFIDVNRSEQKGDDYPVHNVTYHDAIAFINALNDECRNLFKSINVPFDDDIFVLPTQAQWEYAAREGSKGSSDSSACTVYSGSSNPDVVAWHYGNAKSPQLVARKAANSLGIFDLSGNVWEWCRDYYQADFYKSCKDKGLVKDPCCEEFGFTRVLRGGSWRFTAGECRLTRIGHWPEDYASNDVGFRLVTNVTRDRLEELKRIIKGNPQ